MKSVIYARYSSDNQREASIDGQIRECREYAEKNGIIILDTYIDRALSARTADRPSFQEMISDSSKHIFDSVLVWKLDRFSRDRYDSAYYKHILKKNGVSVISVKENITNSPEGIILESMIEGMNEYYSAELSVKVRRGQKENVLNGKNNGGSLPLGYKIGKDGMIEIDPKTERFVHEIFDRYENGNTMKSIAEYMNIMGIKNAKGNPYNSGTVARNLKNRKYIGEYSYGGNIQQDIIPAIITKEQFDKVQRKINGGVYYGGKYKAQEEYILSGKMFCGKCGRKMAGESGRSKRMIHRYYSCMGLRKEKICNLKAKKKDWLEEVILRSTTESVLTDDMIDYIANIAESIQDEENPKIAILEDKLKQCNKTIENIMKAVESGVFSETILNRLQCLEKDKAEMSIELNELNKANTRLTKEDISEWMKKFKFENIKNKRYRKMIVDLFVNSIYVYDDFILINYNFNKESSTVSYGEIKEKFDCMGS